MKTLRFFNLYILLVVIITGTIGFVSCSDNDDGGGQPEIYNVRITDPTKGDSTFTGTFPGQMIAAIGKNLGGIQKIFVNNQEVEFNANYCSSTSVIFTIPGDLTLTGTDPELPNEIRIKTNHGIAIYAFHVFSPAPVINNTLINYPATAGDKMYIIGENFYEIQKIVFEGKAGINIETANYVVSKDYSLIELTIPQGVEDGRLAVYCYTDSTSIGFAVNIPPPSIKTFSSDMPIIGSLAYITGTNFIGVTNLNINGEFDIPALELIVSATSDTVYFSLPKAPIKSGVITIDAAGGNAPSNEIFYPVENVVLNWDDVGSYSWGDNNEPVVADGSKAPYASTGTTYRISGKPGAWQYWWGNLVNEGVYPATATIPGNTPVNSLVLRFECYMNKPSVPASFEIVVRGNWDNIVDFTNRGVTGKWITRDIPLSRFTTASDYSSFVSAGNNELGIYTKNKSDNADVNVDIYFDNFRIIDISK